MKCINVLEPGLRARVTGIQGEGAIRRRLLDMGLLPGSVVVVRRVAPAGDPIWIDLEGSQLALRDKEAATVRVQILHAGDERLSAERIEG